MAPLQQPKGTRHKLRETDFFQEFTAIVAGCLLVVATAAFVSIPASLAHNPWDAVRSVDLAGVRHLT
jgi:hypothetical protein